MTPDAAHQFETMALDDFEELLLDKPRDEKWELIGGRVIRGMVGAPWEHHRIIQNLTGALLNHFRAVGSPCRPFNETFWLKNEAMDLAVFPDVIVRCGKLEAGATHISDPVVLIEVLSKGSEGRDRTEKWGYYQKLPSLQHYALVQRDKPHVELLSRSAEGWRSLTLEGLDGVLNLPAIVFEMPLAEIYRDVIAA